MKYNFTDEVYKTLIQDEILNFTPLCSKDEVKEILYDMEFIVTRIFWEKLDSTLTFAPVLVLKDISQ